MTSAFVEAEQASSPVNGSLRSPRGTGRRHRGAIAFKIGSDILSGAIAPGDTLPTEITASAGLDVSRAAYREAVRTLAAKGLVESRTKAGTIVLPRGRWNLLDPDVLAWAFSGTPDLELVRSLFELRRIFEPAAAGLAAQRRSKAQLQLLKSALARMKRHTLVSSAGQEADREFHSTLLAMTGNDVLMSLSASVGAVVGWTTRFKQRSKALPRDPIPDHVAVADAVAAQDAAAAEAAMRRLVDMALEDTRQNMYPADD